MWIVLSFTSQKGKFSRKVFVVIRIYTELIFLFIVVVFFLGVVVAAVLKYD